MKKKHRNLKIIAIFALLLFIVVYACREEFYDSYEEKNETLTVDFAKSWYEEHKPEAPGFRSLGERVEILIKPDWANAFTKKNGKFETVESDLISLGMYCIIHPTCMEKYNETQDDKYLRSYSRIVFRTDRKTNETVGFLMTQVPDLKFLEDSKFKPFKKTHYLERDPNFYGWILFHNLDGSFANGWEYTKGKITGSINYCDIGPVDFSFRSSSCWSEPVYDLVYVWTDWYTVREDGPDLYTGSTGGHCEWEFVGYVQVCVDSSSNSNSGEYNGGGSGPGHYGNDNGNGNGNGNSPDNPCESGKSGNTMNNGLFVTYTDFSNMNTFFTDKASTSYKEWSVSIGKSGVSYFSSQYLEGTSTSVPVPPPPPGTDFFAFGHNHTKNSNGVPSIGDLYTFLELVRDNTTMKTMYVYGTGWKIVNNKTQAVPEIYTITVHNRAAALDFLRTHPASSNLINGENGLVYGTDLYTAYNFGKGFTSNESYPFLQDAAALSYVMSLFNMGVTLSRKTENDSFKTINSKKNSPSDTKVTVTTCN